MELGVGRRELRKAARQRRFSFAAYTVGMTDAPDALEANAEPPVPAPPITSRFLFVDVAAQRAKQLRRGALPRVERQPGASGKLERMAMQEVRQGLIGYTLPPTTPPRER
jgi:DNA-directed RNA polymerase subunit K/omega